MKILCYTRTPKEDLVYNSHMAYSMHLAYLDEAGKWQPFHHNEGILYAKAVADELGVLHARCLTNPRLKTTEDGAILVTAQQTLEDGTPEDQLLAWTTKDLVHYTEVEPGTVTTTAEAIAYDPETMEALEGVICGNVIEITEAQGAYMKHKLIPPTLVKIELTDGGVYESLEEAEKARALCYYSDGAVVSRRIRWTQEGDALKGTIIQERMRAPFAEWRADPVCMYRDGKYYFIATNDADYNHSLYMRSADTLEGLQDAEEKLFLDTTMYEDIKDLFWAPEFHEIGGKLYIFHGASDGKFDPEAPGFKTIDRFCRVESHVRELAQGAAPDDMSAWSEPRRVRMKDGSLIGKRGEKITLDMTTVEYEGKLYAIWSQRDWQPVDYGAWLLMAEMDPNEPWKMLTDPVVLAKPEYSWENNHTYVVEGPYALWNDGQLFISYAAAAVDATYTVGLLKLQMGTDFLDPANWSKVGYPLMSSNSCPGEYGTGHNSYVTDEYGTVWNFYHGKLNITGPRSSFMRRVHFDIDGEPMLDLHDEIDLPLDMRQVTAVVSDTAAEK